MATIQTTAANHKQLISEGTVVLDFWAPWCAPCRSFEPIFEEASERYPSITFGKVNTDEEQELAASYRIRSIPTLVAIKDGTVVHRQVGALEAGALDVVLRGLLALPKN